MGYSTDFTGSVTVEPALNPVEIAFLAEFSRSRRHWRPEGPYSTKHYSGGSDLGDWRRYNQSPDGQPSLWCDWVATADGAAIEWNGQEKFHDAQIWMAYLIDHFLRAGAHAIPHLGFEGFTFDHVVNGTIHAEGEDREDVWDLVVTDNVVTGSSPIGA
jgi:hypothetical protein